MVEGGARVIGSFLSAAQRSDPDGGKVVDALVVTVAPTLVGDAGVGYGSGLFAETVSLSCCHAWHWLGLGLTATHVSDAIF